MRSLRTQLLSPGSTTELWAACDETIKSKEKACPLCIENDISRFIMYSKTSSRPDKSAGHFFVRLAGLCCVNTDAITLTWPSSQHTLSKDERHVSFQMFYLVKLKLLENVITLHLVCV